MATQRQQVSGAEERAAGQQPEERGEEQRKSCSAVMTKDPVCCLPSDTVDQVAQQMMTNDVGSLPVVENLQTRQLVGIITDRDLALRVVAEGRDSHSTMVEEVMTKEPAACRATDDLEQALRAMATYQVRRIPVVDADNELIGIITQADIATRIEEPTKTAEVVEEISKNVESVVEDQIAVVRKNSKTQKAL